MAEIYSSMSPQTSEARWGHVLATSSFIFWFERLFVTLIDMLKMHRLCPKRGTHIHKLSVGSIGILCCKTTSALDEFHRLQQPSMWKRRFTADMSKGLKLSSACGVARHNQTVLPLLCNKTTLGNIQ